METATTTPTAAFNKRNHLDPDPLLRTIEIHDYEPAKIARALDWMMDDLCSYYEYPGPDNFTFENLQLLRRLRNAFLKGSGVFDLDLGSGTVKQDQDANQG